MAAARDMQRRATLPTPRREPAQSRRPTKTPWGMGAAGAPPPRGAGPFDPAAELHHSKPSQQARQNASYGRIRPQGGAPRPQRPPPQEQKPWNAHRPPNAQKPGNGQRPQNEPRQTTRGSQHQRGAPDQRSGPQRQDQRRAPNTAGGFGMPPISELFAMFGNMGGGPSAPEPPPPMPEFDTVADESMDFVLMMALLLLLKKENADQGLLLALMYIIL